MSASETSFDCVVVGAGPAGRAVAPKLAQAGLRVAAVEAELVGGECPFWACIPTKTLLRPVEVRAQAAHVAGLEAPGLRWPEVAAYRDYMTSGLDDSGKAAALEQGGVTLVRGAARLDGPGRVVVGDRVLRTERVVLAPGTTAAIAPVDGLDPARVWTNREATSLRTVPESVIVLGGGPVGVECAQYLRGFGARVTLVQRSERLLPREDPGVSELVARGLREQGVEVRTGTELQRVRHVTNELVEADVGDGEPLRAQHLMVATGRTPRTAGLGLETVGITPDDGGRVEVDERCRAAEGVWAAGDVTGVAPFTHVASYQGRVAAADVLGQGFAARYGAIPRVVFSEPEVAAVGLTERGARERALEVRTAQVELGETDRTETFGRDLLGGLGVVADARREVLVGAWAVGPLASEWIHAAVMAVHAEVPLAVLRDYVPQFPTFSELLQAAVGKLG